MALDLTQHPCFNSDVRHRTGRIHLPVAPRCNIQCNYCDRKFDCANESRPGVTSSVLSPTQAMAYLDRALEKTPYLKVVGIAGPGDPFANPEETMETLRLVREKYPEMLLCVATNGLNVEPYVAELTQLQVSHVTFTVNAVDPEIGAQIYAWVRDGRAIYRNEAGASLLWERQKQAIAALKNNGVIVKINTIVVPGINDTHTEDVAIEMRALGADIMNCIPLYPVKDTPFEDREQLGAEPIRRLRKTVQAYLPQMKHCTRCRADAVGLLGEPPRDELVTLMRACADGTFDNELANPDRPYVAVASMEGFLVNQHLGEATRLWVFGPGDPNPRLIDTRATPEPGDGMGRWRELAQTIQDCRAVIVSGIGRKPRWALEKAGLKVVEASGLISQAVSTLYESGDVPTSMRKPFRPCGSGSECHGSGAGCS
ncbi:MAG: radical SAM protein [Candidatus Sulfotelmatobacter sp.]